MKLKPVALAMAVLLSACTQSMTKPDAPVSTALSIPATVNPLLVESPLPFHLPPFDLIRDEHFKPAFELSMQAHRQEIDAIAANPQPPTFANTIVAMERSGSSLGRVATVFFNLSASNSNEALQQLEADVAPQLSAHSDAILLNDALFARVRTLYEQRDQLQLDPESKRLLERYYIRFVRAGALLTAEQKLRVQALNAEESVLTTRFQNQLRKDSNELAIVIDDVRQLDGMSADDIAAAAEAARARGLDGKWVLALLLPTQQPALASLTNRELRTRIQQASESRGARGNDNDNREVLLKIAQLRAERAALFGYASYADYVLQESTAGSAAAVNARLAAVTPAAVANARREAADLQQLIDAEGGGFKLAAEDWAIYAEKVRKARYDFDESQMRPYLELDRVLKDGVFFMAEKLYGLKFSERHDLPVYHSDVRVFEATDVDGSALGLYLFDPFARPSKRGGAWMNSLVDQSRLTGYRPVVINNLNVPKPPQGEPVLLSYDDANTLFHEFGHAIHGLLSDVQYPFFSGTSVPRDFVEYPSQVHEMWMTWPEVLANYARHYQTGAPMPQQMVDKLAASAKFNQGFVTTEYLAAALLDQTWHQLSVEQARAITDATAFEAQALQAAGVDFAPVPPRYRSSYFAHIFEGGYAAGYYSYIWSEVLDADTVEWFKENGGLTLKNGQHFRDTLLSRGGSVDALQLFRDFRGRDADIAPLLERRGLVTP